MVLYDEPINNTIDYGQVLVGINNASGGWLGFGILLTIFVVSFVAFKAYSSAKAFATSMFITFITSLMLTGLNLISPFILGFVAILFAASFVFVHLESSNSPY